MHFLQITLSEEKKRCKNGQVERTLNEVSFPERKVDLVLCTFLIPEKNTQTSENQNRKKARHQNTLFILCVRNLDINDQKHLGSVSISKAAGNILPRVNN